MTHQDERESLNEQGRGKTLPVKPRERKAPRITPPKPLPRWRVILHNDEVNDIVKVVQVVRQLTRLSKEESITRTLEAHRSGVALLLVTHQERAELYVEQFATYRLTVTAEPET